MTEPTVATKQMIERIFDGAASSYNRAGPSIFTWFGTRLVESLSLAPGARVLDVATGTGAALLPAARRVGPQGRVTGVDLSGEILREAERVVHEAGLENVELRKMDAEHLEFPDEAFDAVTCAFGLFLFPDMNAALREMHRVCMPDGHLAVTYFHKAPPPFDPGMPILTQQFTEYRIGVRMSQALSCTTQEMDALLDRSGFRPVNTYNETSDIVYANIEDWWAFLLTLMPRGPIMGMSEKTRAQFREEYLAKLRPMVRQDGLHISLGVVYALAKR